jgi:hypothetical protein
MSLLKTHAGGLDLFFISLCFDFPFELCGRPGTRDSSNPVWSVSISSSTMNPNEGMNQAINYIGKRQDVYLRSEGASKKCPHLMVNMLTSS